MWFRLFILVSIFGLGAKAQAQTCPPNFYWVKAHPRSEYARADGVSYSAAHVVGHCRSKSKTYDFWVEKFVNGRIDGWPHLKEQFKNWSSKEIELAINLLTEVPEFLWTNVAIYRASESATKGNPASSAKGVIVLYDSAFKKGGNLARYITHELGHEIFRNMSEFNMTTYRMAGGWIEK